MKYSLDKTLFISTLLLVGVIVTLSPTQGLGAQLQPIIPAIGSFIIPGAGQLLNNQPNKALTHFAIIVGIDTVTYWVGYRRLGNSYLLGSLHLAWSAYSAYDAYEVARRRRGGLDLSSWDGVESDLFSESNSQHLVAGKDSYQLAEEL